VIVSYRDRRTAAFAARRYVKALSGVEMPARLALDRLAAVRSIDDVRVLQSHGLETLAGEGRVRYAVRINGDWRVCFDWPDASPGPTNVELVDSESGGHLAPSTIHPGEQLAEKLRAVNMNASELARRIQVPTNRVTKILNGQRGITADTALRLARFFGTSAEVWLNLQSLHDLRVAEAKAGAVIQRLPTLKARSCHGSGLPECFPAVRTTLGPCSPSTISTQRRRP
jgi:addiction module HigA family antidote